MQALDAPHTGARLETAVVILRLTYFLDAPHTGARLETSAPRAEATNCRMPPTRGHDLKPGWKSYDHIPPQMPPTRGHDLKRLTLKWQTDITDAPHTGARLETARPQFEVVQPGDAPHTGARLETGGIGGAESGETMPPTRGHDLKPGGNYNC